MGLMNVTVRGDFTDEPREEMEATLDMDAVESVVAVEIAGGGRYCMFCDEMQEDAEGTECRAAGDRGHTFIEPTLAWAEKVTVEPDADNDEVNIRVRLKGKEGVLRLTLTPDPSGRVRLAVDTDTPALPLERMDVPQPDKHRTDFLAG